MCCYGTLGIIDTYQQILLNELKPNAMTYYLTVYGYMLQVNRLMDGLTDGWTEGQMDEQTQRDGRMDG